MFYYRRSDPIIKHFILCVLFRAGPNRKSLDITGYIMGGRNNKTYNIPGYIMGGPNNKIRNIPGYIMGVESIHSYVTIIQQLS